MRVLLTTAAVMFAAPTFAACNADLFKIQDWSIKAVNSDTNEIAYTLKANTDKPIRMVDASIGFIDALGKNIGSMAIDRDATIPAGGTYADKGLWGKNTFERLLKLKKEEVTTFTCVRAVLYDDGSKEEFK